jgi:hypothetical protein
MQKRTSLMLWCLTYPCYSQMAIQHQSNPCLWYVQSSFTFFMLGLIIKIFSQCVGGSSVLCPVSSEMHTWM